MIDLAQELALALTSMPVCTAISNAIRAVMREELHAAKVGTTDLVDAHVAARALGMTTSAVRKAAYRGTIPCVRVRRRLRFRLSDLSDPSKWRR